MNIAHFIIHIGTQMVTQAGRQTQAGDKAHTNAGDDTRLSVGCQSRQIVEIVMAH